MKFEELAPFRKDLKGYLKKFRTLEEDRERIQNHFK